MSRLAFLFLFLFCFALPFFPFPLFFSFLAPRLDYSNSKYVEILKLMLRLKGTDGARRGGINGGRVGVCMYVCM